jgi:uncharacterized membrane protein YfcA
VNLFATALSKARVPGIRLQQGQLQKKELRMLMPALWLSILALLAFGISSLTGGGAGLMLIPVLGHMLPTAQVPAALSVGSTISSASRMAVFFRHIDWRIVRWFVPAAIPAVWLGAWLLSRVNPLYLEFVLGLFLLANLPLLIRPNRGEPSGRKGGNPVLILIGAAAGFVSGLTGAVGLIFNRFYLGYGLGKEQIIATRAANEIILHIIKMVLYGLFGLLSPAAFGYGLLIGTAALLATWLVRRVLPYLSEPVFKRIGYGAMVASGAVMFSNAGTTLAAQQNVVVDAQMKRDGIVGKLQWQDAAFSLEFKYDEGFEIEKVIAMDDLPSEKRQLAMVLSEGADTTVVEEVHAIGKHSYELYVYKGGALAKYKL